jgi:hypothetical protein
MPAKSPIGAMINIQDHSNIPLQPIDLGFMPITTDWAGVCYLTPEAPLSSGTGLFKHKSTGRSRYDYKTEKMEDAQEAWDECQDMTKWEMVDRVGNVFNRLILYRADNFHVSLDYFGKDLYDGRLFQVFFFNTEY